MKKTLALFSLLLIPLMICSTGFAQPNSAKRPNLEGTWNCRGQGIVLGQGNHMPQNFTTPTEVSLNSTYVFEPQDGVRIIGTKSTQLASEQVLGIVAYDNKTVELVDQDGYYTWTVVDDTKATLIYKEADSTSSIIGRSRCYKQ